MNSLAPAQRPASPARFDQHSLLMLLAVLSPALVLLAMVAIGHIQNRSARTHEQTQGRVVVSMLKGDMAAVIKDNAYWDGAYRTVVLGSGDVTGWLDETWGTVTDGVAIYDSAFLLGENAQILFAAARGKRLARSDVHFSARQMAMVHKAHRLGIGSPEPQVFFMMHEGMPALVAMNDIVPTTAALRNPAAPQRTLMFLRHLSPQDISTAGANSGLADLHFAGASASAGAVSAEDSMGLLDLNGQTIGHLTWTPQRPGAQLLTAVSVGLMPVLLLLSLITVRTVRQSRRDHLNLVASEMTAHHLANHDTLTGLPNRRAFGETLNQKLHQAQSCAILYIDLDGFKVINDCLCHDAGDTVLKEAGARLARLLTGNDLLARLGGDEFAILISGVDSSPRAPVLASAIVTTFAEPFPVAGQDMHVGASIGIAFPDANISGSELMRRADIAMYAAKAAGKNSWQQFDSVMDEGRSLRQALEAELRTALLRDEIFVAYQPVVSARDHRLIGVEALARWNNPARGLVGPDVFIPIAEASGLIMDIGRKVLRDACMAGRNWDIDVAVNLSPAQFRHAGLKADIQKILEDTGFPASRLELELTEGFLIQNPEGAQKTITELRKLGIRVSLDDFGTGYASIGYLRRFTLDKIKIDKSFVDRIAHDDDSASITNAIIALGSALRLPITAEGVENADQATVLRIAGCAQFQGWLFGKPMPAVAIAAFIETSRAHLRVVA